MRAIATTERQQVLLDAEMVVYQRGYIAELSKVLQVYIKTPVHHPTDGQLTEFGKTGIASPNGSVKPSGT